MCQAADTNNFTTHYTNVLFDLATALCSIFPHRP